MSEPGLPSELMAGPLLPEAPSAGGEAVAHSETASSGLEAFRRVQALNGARPEASDLKAMLMYVLTEGMGAPSAADMVAVLEKFGVKIPGVSDENAGFD